MQKQKDSHLTGRKSLIQFDYSSQIKKLQKMIDCEILKNSPKNVYDGVFFNKIANLHCTGCNSAITRTHQRSLLQYVPKN